MQEQQEKANAAAERVVQFVTEIEQVDGLRCLPLNRTLSAMKSLGMN